MMKIQKLDLQNLCYTSSITRVMPDGFSGKEKSSAKEDRRQRLDKPREVVKLQFEYALTI